MREEIVSTGTALSSHPGKNTEDAIARARKQMDEQLAELCAKWNSSRAAQGIEAPKKARAHVIALSCTPTVEQNVPYAHIVYSYELRREVTD